MAGFSWKPSSWLISALLPLSAGVLPAMNCTKPAVVLVHGIYDSEAKMAWLARQFQLAGYETCCPGLTPADGSIPLAESARRLDEAVSLKLGSARPLHVVGFSMGGLITRYWIAHFPTRNRIISFATISAPHHGTQTASFLGLPGIREMRPGSPFLRDLQTKDPLFAELQPLSLYTPLDLMIVPAGSSIWPVARNEKLWSPLHPLMVFSPAVARRLLRNMEMREIAR